MKKYLKIIPALCMLLIAAMLVSAATYAWFASNEEVIAKGMKVQAKGEDGLVISNAVNGTYNKTADSAKTTCAILFPGSTKDLSTWLHSKSTNPSIANVHEDYDAGVEWQNNNDFGNYVVHDFYIRSSNVDTLTVSSLNIKSVSAKVNGADATQRLSPALRVGIKFEGSSNYYIYAPVAGFTSPVSIQASTGQYSASGRTNVFAIAGNTLSADTSITSIPSSSQNGQHVTIYIWYEGEDDACISDNLYVSLEQFEIRVEFSYSVPTP